MEVSISHYKSIEKAQMKLGKVTVLLGSPAAGKSNVLEAIALATYFDRYAFYVDREPLSRLVRTDDVSNLFTFYDLTKTIEISINTDKWRRSLRIYFQQGLRLKLNDTEVPITRYAKVPIRSLYLFSYSGSEYGIVPDKVDKLLGVLGENVITRLYGFDRFKDDVIKSIVNGVEVEAPQNLLREDGKNFGLVAKKQLEVIRDVSAELAELSRVEVKLLDDGRVVVFDNHIAMKPSAISDSVFRILYILVGLSSAIFFTKLHGLEGRTVVLLEEPEGQLFPQFFNLLVKYIAKFSEVGYVVITTHNPILVSLLRDRLDVTLYYVYRGDGGLTEVAELDKDKLAEELVTSEDILFMKPREVLRLCRRAL
ncbi:AAA domain [Pyrobaculum sp. WP30]|nr:AAA domain [Pyrobaculum sp. WP30]